MNIRHKKINQGFRIEVMIAIIYTFFAIIATTANLASQLLVVTLDSDPQAIFASILLGTSVGLITKYYLDKRFIFTYQTTNRIHNSKIFGLYTMTGIITTMIFWGTEFGFNSYFKSDQMRYFGGAIGLAIGYLIKYQLDKRYVFRKSNS
jgi:putative flippase GtrA